MLRGREVRQSDERKNEIGGGLVFPRRMKQRDGYQLGKIEDAEVSEGGRFDGEPREEGGSTLYTI